MGAYILRRLLLIIPTLIGIMIINFVLTQFVPGGPIEQIIAQMEGGGDVFESFAGGGSAGNTTGMGSPHLGDGMPLLIPIKRPKRQILACPRHQPRARAPRPAHQGTPQDQAKR